MMIIYLSFALDSNVYIIMAVSRVPIISYAHNLYTGLNHPNANVGL